MNERYVSKEIIHSYEMEHYDEVTSTNDLCIERGKSGGAGHYVVSAQKQTKGRGRNGRTWVSTSGDGIYLSIMERPKDLPVDLVPNLSLVMGMAANKALKEVTELHSALKWPNDLVIGGKKLSGILCQMFLKDGTSQVNFVVAGIGINIRQEVFLEEIANTATSVKLELLKAGKNPTEDDLNKIHKNLEKSIVKWWETYYNQLLQEGSFARLKDEYNTMCINKDRLVEVLDPKGAYKGIAKGVDETGALLVEREDGSFNRIISGEVSVRGIYGYV